MLHLHSETNPEWLNCALKNLPELLVDHAHCEHKVAAAALSMIASYGTDPVIVDALARLASEEADHLRQVAAFLPDFDMVLHPPQSDLYATQLMKAIRKDGPIASRTLDQRVDRLLVCSLIEARSCERLKLLAYNLNEPNQEKLRAMYQELWKAEAGHHTLFVQLAQRSFSFVGQYSAEDAKIATFARLDQLAAIEAEIVSRLPIRAVVH